MRFFPHKRWFSEFRTDSYLIQLIFRSKPFSLSQVLDTDVQLQMQLFSWLTFSLSAESFTSCCIFIRMKKREETAKTACLQQRPSTRLYHALHMWWMEAGASCQHHIWLAFSEVTFTTKNNRVELSVNDPIF